MKLRTKLVVAMLLVAAAPIGIGGIQAVLASRQALEQRIRELLETSSRSEAELIGNTMRHYRHTLALAASGLVVDESQLTPLSEQLARIYLLSPHFNAVGLFEAQGKPVAPLTFVDERQSFPEPYRQHEQLDAGEVQRFLAAAKALAVRCRRPASGAIYRSQRKGRLQLPLAAPAGRSSNHCLVVELSLAGIQEQVARLHLGRSGFAVLLDDHGRVVAHPRPERALARQDLSRLPLVSKRLGTTSPAVGEYRDRELGTMLGAYAPVPHTRWALLVSQPLDEAMRPVVLLGWQLGGWLALSLLVATLAGLLLASRITRPVHTLVRGTEEIGRGNLTTRISVFSRDELGELGRHFNLMGEQLLAQRRRIEAQTEEIRSWNLELQRRVEERTRQLRQAQQQLLQAQKMAAVGELGAGVAHEVNNPLMGVLGCAQLLLMRHGPNHPDHQLLTDIEQQAQRIRTIVSRLLEASQSGAGDLARLELKPVLEAAVAERRKLFAERGITLELQTPNTLPPVMGRTADLEQALGELLDNACQALGRGGRVRLGASGTEGEVVRLIVEDDGPGIAPAHLDRVFEPFFTTKQNWQAQGLGLTRVYQVIQDHSGSIAVESEPGKFTRFTIVLPALQRSTHLR